MSVDATACTLRITTGAATAAKAHEKFGDTAFRLMKASNCAWVAAEDILRGHTKGFLLRRFVTVRWEELLVGLPADWVEAMRAGWAGLILDHSVEAIPYHNRRPESWHQDLKAHGIPPSRIVLVTQNRNFQDGYNRWCEENGVEDRIAIFNYDYIVSRFCRESRPDPAAALAERIRDFDNRNQIEKRFVCLNYKPRILRIALLTRLIKDGYWDDGFISFGGFEIEWKKLNGSIVKLGDSRIEKFRSLKRAGGSKAYLEALIAKGQMLFGEDPGSGKAAEGEVWRAGDDNTIDIYRRSAFTLVTETHMRKTADRITEKPLKPLANCHPAILFANYGALALLRSFGFRTFEPWIDEGYDRIEDPEARFLAAYEAFRQFDKTAWDQVREDRELRDVLCYNAEHAMVNLPRLYDETLDPKLCREIAGVLENA